MNSRLPFVVAAGFKSTLPELFKNVLPEGTTVESLAAALGPVAGLGAARVVASHFSVIVRDTAQLFVAGPPVVGSMYCILRPWQGSHSL